MKYMKKWIAILVLAVMLANVALAIAEPMNTIWQMQDIINEILDSSAQEGVQEVCMYLEDQKAFAIGIESDIIAQTAAGAAIGKGTEYWNAFKAYIYKLYENIRELLDIFGHDKQGLYVILRGKNNGEWFGYYMLGDNGDGIIEVEDVVTHDTKPVQTK